MEIFGAEKLDQYKNSSHDLVFIFQQNGVVVFTADSYEIANKYLKSIEYLGHTTAGNTETVAVTVQIVPEDVGVDGAIWNGEEFVEVN